MLQGFSYVQQDINSRILQRDRNRERNGNWGLRSVSQQLVAFSMQQRLPAYNSNSMTKTNISNTFFSMPFYEPVTGAQMGIYSDTGTRFGTAEGSECISSGAFSFGVPNNSSLYPNQINVA